MRRAALTVLVAAALWPASVAHADPSGSFTRAEATSDWTHASLAGSITWADCPAQCTWLAAVTVQPSLPSYSCRGDELLDSDPNTRQIWVSGQQAANATVAFDVPDALILPGVYGQRACLTAIYHVQVPDAGCIAIVEFMGGDPAVECPPLDRTLTRTVIGATLSVPSPAPPPTAPAQVAPLPSEPVRAAPARRCRRGYVSARIRGRRKCLHRRQVCVRRNDRYYHRYGFHCHRSGRLRRR